MDTLISAIGGSSVGVIVLIALFFYFKQRKAQEFDIPALDLVDAKKLDDMISSQVERALRPLLSKEGYSQEKIEEALTRTSLGAQRFTR